MEQLSMQYYVLSFLPATVSSACWFTYSSDHEVGVQSEYKKKGTDVMLLRRNGPHGPEGITGTVRFLTLFAIGKSNKSALTPYPGIWEKVKSPLGNVHDTSFTG